MTSTGSGYHNTVEPYFVPWKQPYLTLLSRPWKTGPPHGRTWQHCHNASNPASLGLIWPSLQLWPSLDSGVFHQIFQTQELPAKQWHASTLILYKPERLIAKWVWSHPAGQWRPTMRIQVQIGIPQEAGLVFHICLPYQVHLDIYTWQFSDVPTCSNLQIPTWMPGLCFQWGKPHTKKMLIGIEDGGAYNHDSEVFLDKRVIKIKHLC